MLSCNDLGEKAHSQSCDNFLKRREDNQDVSEWVEGLLGALSDVKFRDVFHEIVAENFALDQDYRLAIATIQAQLQTQGAHVSVDETQLERYADRLIDLYVLYRMINAIGMGRYTDEIMKAEIERKFRAFTPNPNAAVKIAKPRGG